MAIQKKSKKNQPQSTVEEVKLDAIVVNEKKPIPRTPLFKNEDEDENNWQDVPKKHASSYDDEADDMDENEEEKDVFGEIEEDEIFFREKGPKSQ
jgi:hypothetical protein